MSKRFIYLLSLLLMAAVACPAQTAQKKTCSAKERKTTTAMVLTPAKRKTVKTVAKDTLKVERVEEVRVSRNQIPTDSCLLSWVNYLTPAREQKKTSSIEGSIVLDYSRGQKTKFDDKNNYEAMYKLQSVLRSLKADPNITIDEIRITGFTAPDGDFRLNEKNGLQRALGLTEYIRSNRSLDAIPYEVNWVAEDWNKLIVMIEDSEMPFKAAVLDIIRTVDVVNGREQTLMNLAGGKPYEYLKSYFFPQLRRIDYVVNYKVASGLDIEASKKVAYADMSLNDFYNMAQSHPVGSDEFNDLLDLAGRLFPDNPVACINAAAVALSKHNPARARNYLMRFATLPEAGNNMGVLYLLEGNRDKAEVYLELARAAGVKQAGNSLKFINKIR